MRPINLSFPFFFFFFWFFFFFFNFFTIIPLFLRLRLVGFFSECADQTFRGNAINNVHFPLFQLVDERSVLIDLGNEEIAVKGFPVVLVHLAQTRKIFFLKKKSVRLDDIGKWRDMMRMRY
jgi:hypothetical protein